MRIVMVHSEKLTCSLCGESIKPDTKALSFWNKGAFHFRHIDCQYISIPRKVSLEEYTSKLLLQDKGRKANLALERTRRRLEIEGVVIV